MADIKIILLYIFKIAFVVHLFPKYLIFLPDFRCPIIYGNDMRIKFYKLSGLYHNLELGTTPESSAQPTGCAEL